jgi:hypothetical protein
MTDQERTAWLGWVPQWKSFLFLSQNDWLYKNLSFQIPVPSPSPWPQEWS